MTYKPDYFPNPEPDPSNGHDPELEAETQRELDEEREALAVTRQEVLAELDQRGVDLSLLDYEMPTPGKRTLEGDRRLALANAVDATAEALQFDKLHPITDFSSEKVREFRFGNYANARLIVEHQVQETLLQGDAATALRDIIDEAVQQQPPLPPERAMEVFAEVATRPQFAKAPAMNITPYSQN